MGMSNFEQDFANSVLQMQQMCWKNLSVVELGDQIWKSDLDIRYPAKKYYENLNVLEHVSIDINGLNGALKLDLNKDLPMEFHNRFDIVTNYGTSEHVSNQSSVFKNIHNLCKENGIMIHVVPYINNWPKHCEYKYDVTFFEKLIFKNKYKMLSLKVLPKYFNSNRMKLSYMILIALCKIKQSDFIWIE